jgi:hypothetical protein
MKRSLVWTILGWLLSGLVLTASITTINKKENEYGEIEYSPQWKPSGMIEEVKLVKYPREKGRDDWRYLLHITVANPRRLSTEPARLIAPDRHYDIATFFTDENNWRPYSVSVQTPQKTDQIITDITSQNRLMIQIVLEDGATASVEVPTAVLQDWRSLVALRLQWQIGGPHS